MTVQERIVEAAQRLVGATTAEEYHDAFLELRDELCPEGVGQFAEEATDTTYTNLLIGGYQP